VRNVMSTTPREGMKNASPSFARGPDPCLAVHMRDISPFSMVAICYHLMGAFHIC
jgi:hypothetical protein